MPKFYFLFCLSFFILFLSCENKNDEFNLQTGDLLFSVGKEESGLHNAIQSSTGQNTELAFTHVGIVNVENEKTHVLEAIPSGGVVKTPLEDYFENSAFVDNKYLIAVGRVKKEFEYIIPNAIKNAEKNLGKKYDFAYDESNDEFYCSELVRFAYLDSLQNPIFESLSMTFKNSKTNSIDAYWVQHFEKLGKPVPEGEPGTNPADMSKSPVIEIVYRYY